MVITTNINIDDNFWEANPNFKAAGPFASMYKSDKSRGKALSSKKAWCIALIYDRKSEFYNIPEKGEDNKIDLVFDEFYGDTSWPSKNEKEFNELRDFYLKITETPAMASLRQLEEKLVERADFLRDTKYDIGMTNDKGQLVGGTADTLDRMFANSQKIFEMVEKTRQIVNQEEGKATRGDIVESLSETGKI